LALHDNRPKAALAIVKVGAERIEEFYRQLGHEELLAKSGELAVLRAFAKEIQGRIPADPLKKVKDELDKAIREERYEDAAQLRDKLRRSGEKAETEEPSQNGQ